MYPLVLFVLVILVNKIDCIDLQNDPNIPCGIRYNFQPGKEPENNGTANQSGLIRARTLSGSSTLVNSGRKAEHLQNLKQDVNTLQGKQASPRAVPKHGRHSRHKKLNSRAFKSEKASHAKNNTGDSKKQMEKNKSDLKVKTRIIGGHQASIKEFPWLVSIQVKGGGHLCGGSIVNDEYIVTASHCVVDPSTNELVDRKYQIAIGSSSWSEGRKYDVVEVIKHQGFKFTNFEDDLAIMKVRPKIELKKDVTVPICLPGETDAVVGNGTIAGWGKTRNDMQTTSNHLMMANIGIMEDSFCENAYSNFNSKKMLCAGTESGVRDSCNGDSGGPFQALFPDGRVYLLGSVSFGDSKCGRARLPGVYTRQTYYLNWVRETIAKLKQGDLPERSVDWRD